MDCQPRRTERRWKNPTEVMKMRKKKLQRKASANSLEASPTTQNKENSPLVTATGPGVRPLREPESSKQLTQSRSPVLKRPRTSCLQEISNTSKKRVFGENVLLSVPLDWSLKVKARFTSLHSFSWASAVKTHQEANGISRYVRGSPATEEAVDEHTELQRHLMVWMHPSLPFVKLFPRVETKLTTHHQPSLLQDQQVLDALKDDWSTSFRSVFQLLKADLCPYFYLCANQFTALFLAAGVSGSIATAALLTPTTSGLRQQLKKEGVEFSLPLAPASVTNGEPVNNENLEDSENEDDTTATSWLHSMGLVTDDLPTAINPQRIALQKSRIVDIDNRPESVVRVEGLNVHALFNFLLNSKTTVTTTGAQAGVPPTLLAPTAFEGAVLKSLKMKQNVVHEHTGGKLTRVHSLDISGPILPQTLHNLCTLFQRTQQGNFSAYLNCIESTGGFNPGAKIQSSLPPPTTVTRHTPAGCIDMYIASEPISQKNGLREVFCENSLYNVG